MTKNIEVIGESSFLFDFDGIKLLTDPWFGEAIYGGAWSQFPIPYVEPSQICELSYIFISHVHSDHCCIESINKAMRNSPDCKFLIMDRGEKDCFLTKKLSAILKDDFLDRIVKIKPYVEYTISNIKLWCLPPSGDNAINELIDSSLLLKTTKGLVLFANDNMATTTHADFINSLRIHQYIAMLPFSGGSGYPSSYENLTQDEKLEAAQKSRSFYEESAVNFLLSTSFDYYMPVAGNHILTSRSYEYHLSTAFLQNPYSVIRRIDPQVNRTKGIYIQPGSNIDINISSLSGASLIVSEEKFDFQKKLFIESISSRIAPWVLELDEASHLTIINSFESYGNQLQRAIGELSTLYGGQQFTVILTSSNVQIAVTKDSFTIYEHDNSVSAYKVSLKEFYFMPSLLCIDISPRILNGIIQKKIHINEADAGCLLTYYRTMQYIPELYTAIFTILN
jgi:hypothetical protein